MHDKHSNDELMMMMMMMMMTMIIIILSDGSKTFLRLFRQEKMKTGMITRKENLKRSLHTRLLAHS